MYLRPAFSTIGNGIPTKNLSKKPLPGNFCGFAHKTCTAERSVSGKGKPPFYLEALDRDVKKPNENPSVGLILCASKDDAVVEYALSRTMSPTLVADYTLYLPDKKVLQYKLRELAEIVWDTKNQDDLE